MNQEKTFDQWFSEVRDLLVERGIALPISLPEKDLNKWRGHYTNMLEPSEAVYNMVTLADTQIGTLPFPNET